MPDIRNRIQLLLTATGLLLASASLSVYLSPLFPRLVELLTPAFGAPTAAKLTAVLLQGVIGGVLLAAGAWSWHSILAHLQTHRAVLAVSIALVLVLWLPQIIAGPQVSLGSTRYWFLSDDAMISMRYGRNLADGLGLVWNAGEPVEGYTNFLWVLWMGVVHLVTHSDSLAPLMVLLSGLGLQIATLFALFPILRRYQASPAEQLAILILVAVNQTLFYWVISGLETPLLTFLLVAGGAEILRAQDTGEVRRRWYWILALLPLVRSDALLLAAMLGVAGLLFVRRRVWYTLFSLLALVPTAAHILFRRLYYGDWLPNTAWLKVFGWDGKWWTGLEYVGLFLLAYLLFLLPWGYAAIRQRLKTPWFLVVMAGIWTVYVVSVGGDAFPCHRFLAPWVPFLILFGTLGAFRGFRRWTRSLWLAFVLLGIGAPSILPRYALELLPSNHVADSNNVRIGVYIRENTPSDISVADTWAGATLYYSHRRGVDLLGKMDPVIAHGPAVEGDIPGHNKFNFDYSLGMKQPDILVSSVLWPVSPEKIGTLSAGNFAYAGRMLTNPEFIDHYVSNPVEVPTARTLFVRDSALNRIPLTGWTLH